MKSDQGSEDGGDIGTQGDGSGHTCGKLGALWEVGILLVGGRDPAVLDILPVGPSESAQGLVHETQSVWEEQCPGDWSAAARGTWSLCHF